VKSGSTRHCGVGSVPNADKRMAACIGGGKSLNHGLRWNGVTSGKV